MIVAVTMRLSEATSYFEKRDSVSHDLISYLDRQGLVPVLVPNTLKSPEGFLKKIKAQGLLLSGGDDIGPIDGSSQTLRDKTEMSLLDAAIKNDLPVLGICRGLQLINCFFGGAITRDIKLETGENHVACNHIISFIADKHEQEVNSFHNQGVLQSDLASPLRALALSAGGVVEALEHTHKNIRAIMWHPERSKASTNFDNKFIKAWLT